MPLTAKLHLPETLHDDLAQLACADRRAVGECLRVILKRHAYRVLGRR